MEERLGEMRRGRSERIEKGSHCFFKKKICHRGGSRIFRGGGGGAGANFL